MARQAGPVKIIGTIDEVTYYKMKGEYYSRMKSSLTGERFWKDKAFEGSRKSCERMEQASPFASFLYSYYPKEKKSGRLWLEIMGHVLKMIKAGWEKEVIQNWFYLEYLQDLEPGKHLLQKAPVQKKRPRKRRVLTYSKARLPRFIYECLPDRDGTLARELREAYEGRTRRCVARESLLVPVLQNKQPGAVLSGEFAKSHQRLLRA